MTRFCKIRSGVGIKVHQTAAIRFDHLVLEISVTNFILSQKSQKWFSSSKSTIRKIWNFCIIVFFIRHKVGNTGSWNWGWRHYPELSPKCLHFEWQSISFHQVLLHNSYCNWSVGFVFSTSNLDHCIANTSFFHFQSDLFFTRNKKGYVLSVYVIIWAAKVKICIHEKDWGSILLHYIQCCQLLHIIET